MIKEIILTPYSMINLKSSCFVLLVVVLCTLSARTQTSEGGNFVSREAGFSIGLPGNSYVRKSVPAIEGVSSNGVMYSWQNAGTSYEISFSDQLVSYNEGRDILAIAAQNLIDRQVADGAKLIDRKVVAGDAMGGIEVNISKPNGALLSSRFYVSGQRLYLVSASYGKVEDRSRIGAVLNTFRLLTKGGTDRTAARSSGLNNELSRIKTAGTSTRPESEPGTKISAGMGSGNSIGTGRGNGTGTSQESSLATENGVTPVRILSRPKAQYTKEAREANIQGMVTLKVTFLANGQIGAISAIVPLPYGLTEQAIAAAKLIKFIPANRNGAPVNSTRVIQFGFNL